MIAYFDSSAFVKLVLPEAGSEDARALYRSATRVVSSRLLSPETSAAVARALRAGRVTAAGATMALTELQLLLDGFVPLEVTPAVAADASRIAVEHGLRAYDAVHFASFERLSSDGATLVASDGELVRVARAVGYSVAVPGI